MIGFVTSFPPMCTVTTSTLLRGLLSALRDSNTLTACGSWFAISVGVVAPPTARLTSSSFLHP